MPDQNKIAKTLSAEELTRFCERLAKSRGVTLQTIADLFEEETGERVSLMGASSFRDTTFARHLQRIGKAGEIAAQIAALKSAGAGHTIADAAAAILSDEVLDKLVNRDPDDEIDLDVLSKVIQRLRSGDAQLAALRHRIEQDQLDAAKLAMKHAEKLKVLQTLRINDEEKVQRVRELLFGAKPADVEAIA